MTAYMRSFPLDKYMENSNGKTRMPMLFILVICVVPFVDGVEKCFFFSKTIAATFATVAAF